MTTGCIFSGFILNDSLVIKKIHKTNFILFHSEKELRAPLLERGYQIRDCSNYPGLTEGWYRIAVKLPEENKGLLSNLEEILNG